MSYLVAYETCPLCHSNKRIEDPDNGEIICRECGYVSNEQSINTGPEWRSFNLDETLKLKRTGNPLKLSLYDQGLTTSISWENQDYNGRNLKQETSIKFHRLRRWNRQTKIAENKKRNMSHAFVSMSKLKDKLNLPNNVYETGAQIYRQILKKEAIRGRSINELSLASLYMACRLCEVSRSLKAFAEAGNIPIRDAAKNYRYIYNLLERDVPRIDSEKIASKLVLQLGLSSKVERISLSILRLAEEEKITVGKHPSGIAASSVYIASKLVGEHLTQKDAALQAKVTEVTIRNRYKDLIDSMNIQIYL
jgi:transcription initiation factor TFIIB